MIFFFRQVWKKCWLNNSSLFYISNQIDVHEFVDPSNPEEHEYFEKLEWVGSDASDTSDVAIDSNDLDNLGGQIDPFDRFGCDANVNTASSTDSFEIAKTDPIKLFSVIQKPSKEQIKTKAKQTFKEQQQNVCICYYFKDSLHRIAFMLYIKQALFPFFKNGFRIEYAFLSCCSPD